MPQSDFPKRSCTRSQLARGAPMPATVLELIPLRPAVRSDAPVTLDLLLRIVPPALQGPPRRPPLNLGLVLDHSGSMAGSGKIDYARQAAAYAVQQLLPEDRVSL